jgi:hypothetical protein
VQPIHYNERPPLLSAYYTYWSGLPMDGRFETYIRPNRGCAAVETHDGLTIVIAGWPYAEFDANKKDVESNYLKTLDSAPACRGTRQAREARSLLCRRRPPELFPEALWSRLGAGG